MLSTHPTLVRALTMLHIPPSLSTAEIAWRLALAWSTRTVWFGDEETAVQAMAMALARGDVRAADHWALYVVDERAAQARVARVEASAAGETVVHEWPAAAVAVTTAPSRRPRGRDYSRANDRADERLSPLERARADAWREVAGRGVGRCDGCWFPSSHCRCGRSIEAVA